MGTSVSLAVIDQINIADSVCLSLAAENQSPVPGDRQAPPSFQCAFERMQLPARKAAGLTGAAEGRNRLILLFP